MEITTHPDQSAPEEAFYTINLFWPLRAPLSRRPHNPVVRRRADSLQTSGQDRQGCQQQGGS